MKKETYLIGEIGQNHNGSMDIARQIIDVVAKPVVDNLFGNERKRMNAVKLTRRDLREELTQSAMDKPYVNANSFGKTYGEHRAFLELSDEQHFEIYQYAVSKELDFVETLCAIACLSLLKLFTPNYLKVASRDLTNLPLLNAMAETRIPMILSTGMGGKAELDNALAVITRHHDNVSILHCLSQYPSEYPNINLRTIDYLKKHYPKFRIGYSDHSVGISVPVAAVAMGAEIIEKHITLDRNMKGTDQKGSLAPDGIYRMVRDIRNIEESLGEEKFFISDAVKESKYKLERSIASNRKIAKGEEILETDMHMLSPGDGLKWADRQQLVGKKALSDIEKDEIIYPSLVG